MADNTTYSVEFHDPQWAEEFGDDGWMNYGKTLNTFSEAQEVVEKASATYRNVQVVKHTRTVVAEYKDGQVSG